MGIGPAVAIPKVLKQTGLSVSDIDIYEINEAFAGQCLYSIESCNIPREKVNLMGVLLPWVTLLVVLVLDNTLLF